MRPAYASLALVLCSATAAHADWSQRTVAGMTVQLYTPTSVGSFPAGRGLMIGLHGCTQQATALAQHGNWESAAERRGVVVALPQVPNGGVLAGCWDYYGANHTRTTRHDGPVLQLVEALLADHSLSIDPAQVYVAGLSSGAGEAMVLGCLAPDVFAGVGINAGPTVGTASSQIATVSTDRQAGVSTCKTMAGAHVSSFDTQLVSIIAGTQDFIVAQGYNALNAEVMRAIYAGTGPELSSAAIDVPQMIGSVPQGTGTLWSDGSGPRVSLVMVQGMGHAFPAGNGTGAEMSFIAQRGPSWPDHLLDLFTENNRRAAGARVDGGVVVPDAGNRPGTDAGAVHHDAGNAGSPDAGQDDAGSVHPNADGGLATSDAGKNEGAMSGGCACTAPGHHPLWALLPGLGLVLARRLRRRAIRNNAG
ncbi:MAG: PHB depolymerase family esterase [Myxococcota bacterium]